MAQTFLSGSNPVLTRELRANLRNVRAFSLLAIYVALLGAIVAANFPGDLSIDFQSDGGRRGQQLFWTLVLGQVFLILVILPALSTGALAQERERQTLQPLLLTPMSPLQIVWGKAGGVLSLVGLLLLSSLPLTSLCFLLGGVSPGMLVCAYCAILGLAVLTTGFGLYCSARWPSATRAMISCYALLPLVVFFVAAFAALGIIFSGLATLIMGVFFLTQFWKKKQESPVATTLNRLFGKSIYFIALLAFCAVPFVMVFNFSIGLSIVGVAFVLSYLVMIAQWGMLQTARLLMVRTDPEVSLRQKVEDIKQDWQTSINSASSTTTLPSFGTSSLGETSAYLPGVSRDSSEWTNLDLQRPAPVSAAPIAASSPVVNAPRVTPRGRKDTQTYGKVPFLPDNLNPIFAREMRSGLLGKFDYLFRFGYIVTILSELLLIAYMGMSSLVSVAVTAEYAVMPFLRSCGAFHLALLMVFGSWFGARAIAPEREGQTLMQLFTIPLPARSIIAGKLMAVIVFTLYIWILAVPMAVLLAMLHFLPWSETLRFILVEAIMGILATAWGVICSFQAHSVRQALFTALGGTCAVLISPFLVEPVWDLMRILGIIRTADSAYLVSSLFPTSLLFTQIPENVSPAVISYYHPLVQTLTPFILAVYVLTALGLFVLTARDFERLARER